MDVPLKDIHRVVPVLSWLCTEGPQSGDCHEPEAQIGDHVDAIPKMAIF